MNGCVKQREREREGERKRERERERLVILIMLCVPTARAFPSTCTKRLFPRDLERR